MRILYYASLSSLFFSVSSVSQASTISISQPVVDRLLTAGDISFGEHGQTFTATGDYSIVAIDLFVQAIDGGNPNNIPGILPGTSFEITLFGFDFDEFRPAGPRLGQGSFLETELSETAQWIRVELDEPAPVTAGETYAFLIDPEEDPPQRRGANLYGFDISGEEYSDGTAYVLFPRTLDYQQRSSDLAFQIVTVPEPSSVLLILGGGFLFASRRTRCGI